jgi:hypothetical protein
MDNWQDIYSCFGDSEEALSTRCLGQDVVVSMAWQTGADTPGSARLRSGRYVR